MGNEFYHPVELSEIYSKVTQLDSDHLTYRLDFFQVKDHKAEQINDPLKPSVSPNETIRKRLQKVMLRKEEACFLMGTSVGFYKANLKTPLLIGSGNTHVRENGLNIHVVYGVPYLPASSLKGLARSWAIHAFFDGDEKSAFHGKYSDLEKGEIQKILFDLFGTQEHRGMIQFQDCYLIDYHLHPDLETVHFGHYYTDKGKTPATEYKKNPVPIPAFYQIRMTKPVSFSIQAEREKKGKSGLEAEELVKISGAWLGKALEEFGIGAKTALGYGRFHHFVNVTEEKRLSFEETEKQKHRQMIVRQMEREKQEREEMMRNLPEEERIIMLISELDPGNSEDRDKSKSKEVYNRIIEKGMKEAAAVLKVYWQQTRDWKVKPKKKKQYDKVQALKKLLDE